MACINLLPWRENQRKERQKDFIQLTVLASILMVVIVGAVFVQVNNLIGVQESRNGYLQGEIKVFQDMITQIKKLEDEKVGLVQRMDVIQKLQRSRPGIVHMFDELVYSIPEGVYFSSVTREGNVVTIEGRAQSNARVSNFMRNLDESIWFDDPHLIVIDSAGKKQSRSRGAGGHRFSLTVNQVDIVVAEGE